MVLADKIMNERKKKGWSQEQLADKLGVSRQSVSKWESAQSMPDINRILELSKLFGISTDYLLKDETENNATDDILKSVEFYENSHIVSMEDAIEFLDIQQKIAPKIALGVSLCILSPVLLIVLFGLSDSGIFGISENLASGAGITVLLVMVAIGVFLFIICNGKAEKYDLLLQQGDYTVNEKKTIPIINRISGIYWPLITAVYLAWSFKTSDWGRTWLIWPVAGVLFGVIETIAKIILKAED